MCYTVLSPIEWMLSIKSLTETSYKPVEIGLDIKETSWITKHSMMKGTTRHLLIYFRDNCQLSANSVDNNDDTIFVRKHQKLVQYRVSFQNQGNAYK